MLIFVCFLSFLKKISISNVSPSEVEHAAMSMLLDVYPNIFSCMQIDLCLFTKKMSFIGPM